jgi:UDP-N-acetylglucosamine--N-acetylmuramyl-(pentapeptide) pyrophosphoryl-undecaprenol N-acetylglucosamine transferase
MKLIIVGGGTGGHIFPGLAIREEFLARGGQNQVLFVGARGGMEEEMLEEEKIDARFIRAGKFAGMSLSEKVKGLTNAFFGVFQAVTVLREFQADFVLGVGGYTTVPVVVASWFLKVPRAIQEQNSYPGLANRVLARISSKVFLSFSNAEKYFDKVGKDKFVLAGNPLRRKVLEALTSPPAPANGKPRRFQIFVVGGSQGARKLNKLMMEAADLLKTVKDQIKIVHMSGSIDQYDLIIAYGKAGIKAKVTRFVEDMGKELREADLVISRAGAGAIFELAAAGKTGILIPFPFAADDHQKVNAEYLSEKGAALVFNENAIDARQLAETILALFGNPQKMQEMGARARKLARLDAAKVIVDEIIKIGEAKNEQ